MLAGDTIAGAPVHVTGFDALQNQTGGGSGPGVLLEAMLGGLGALVVLAFVFASLLRVRPDPDGDRLDHDDVPGAVGRDRVH